MKKNVKKTMLFSAVIMIMTFAAACGLFGGNDNSGIQEEKYVSSDAEAPSDGSGSEKSGESRDNTSEGSKKTDISENAEEASSADTKKPETAQVSESTESSRTGSEDVSEPEDSKKSQPSEKEEQTLRQVYESSAFTGLIDEAAKQYESDDYDISVSLEGENRVIVSATLRQQKERSDIPKSTLNAYFDSISQQAGSYIRLLENNTATKRVTITARLINADGSIIAAKTYTRENTDTSEDNDDNVRPISRNIRSIIGSNFALNLMSTIPEMIGDSGAKVSAEVEGQNDVVISVTLSREIPDGTESAAAAALGDISAAAEKVRTKLSELSGDKDLTVTIRIYDTAGKQIV